MSMKKGVLKEFKNYPSSLYNLKWVEKAANEGLDKFVKEYNNAFNKNETRKNRGLQMLYFAAFEHALRIFNHQVFEDTTREIEFYLDELGELTAEIKKIKKGE